MTAPTTISPRLLIVSPSRHEFASATLLTCGVLVACGGDGSRQSSGGDLGIPEASAEDDDDDDDGDASDQDDSAKLDAGDDDGDDDDSDSGEEVSYIWIANSSQGTVSKINTRTMVEEGRYITRPDQLGDPSRTSVGLGGNVAVANRSGGITKFYANPKDCEDKDNNGTIDTATGSAFLPWDDDECLAWYTPMNYGSQRGLAWTAEAIGGDEDGYKEMLWATGVANADSSSIEVMLLDGHTGEVTDQVTIPVQHNVIAFPYGSYGGAVDRDNNFWFSNHGPGWLVRVSYPDLDVDVFEKSYNSYGITVDPNSNVWICGMQTARYVPSTGTWSAVTLSGGLFGSVGGCMVDAKERLWTDISEGILEFAMGAIDTNTLTLVQQISLPTHAHGVSIDFDGNVWGVPFLGEDRAFRINPDTGQIDTFVGLVDPYTYSDMTGFALAGVHDPPER